MYKNYQRLKYYATPHLLNTGKWGTHLLMQNNTVWEANDFNPGTEEVRIYQSKLKLNKRYLD